MQVQKGAGMQVQQGAAGMQVRQGVAEVHLLLVNNVVSRHSMHTQGRMRAK